MKKIIIFVLLCVLAVFPLNNVDAAIKNIYKLDILTSNYDIEFNNDSFNTSFNTIKNKYPGLKPSYNKFQYELPLDDQDLFEISYVDKNCDLISIFPQKGDFVRFTFSGNNINGKLTKIEISLAERHMDIAQYERNIYKAFCQRGYSSAFEYRPRAIGYTTTYTYWLSGRSRLSAYFNYPATDKLTDYGQIFLVFGLY